MLFHGSALAQMLSTYLGRTYPDVPAAQRLTVPVNYFLGLSSLTS